MKKYIVVMFFVCAALFNKTDVLAAENLEIQMMLSNKYDYTNGYFDKNEPLSIISTENYNGHVPGNIIDNNPQTNANIRNNRYIEITLDDVIDIEAFYLSTSNASTSIRFLDADKNSLYVATYSAGGYIETEIGGVNLIRLTNVTVGRNLIINEFEVFEKSEVVLNPVKSLTAKHTHESVDLSWINPTGASFRKVLIKKNGVEIEELDATKTNYVFSGLKSETEYKFEVIAIYEDGRLSEPTSINVTTSAAPKPVGEVIDLTANADYDRVDLSWQLPDSEKFEHVNIYRDTINKTILDKILGVKSVSAETKIFETNGTYFNDLTVSDDTKYEYLLTTMSSDEIESDGVTVNVLTPKKPKLEIGGAEYEKDENEDFIFKWASPETGKVRVLVGGNVYATVNAVDKKIVINKSEMKYKFSGAPDVSLIAVDEDGNESTPTIPPPATGVDSSKLIKLPFKATDLLQTAIGFVGVLSGLILLALAIWILPRLITIIKSVVLEKKGG